MRQLVALSHRSTIWLGTKMCAIQSKETAWNIMKLLSWHFWQVFLIILIDPSRSPRLITNQAPLFSSRSDGSRIRLLPAQPWIFYPTKHGTWKSVGYTDIAVPSSEYALLPSNIRVSNLGITRKSTTSYVTGLDDFWAILQRDTKGYLMLGPTSIQNPDG